MGRRRGSGREEVEGSVPRRRKRSSWRIAQPFAARRSDLKTMPRVGMVDEPVGGVGDGQRRALALLSWTRETTDLLAILSRGITRQTDVV